MTRTTKKNLRVARAIGVRGLRLVWSRVNSNCVCGEPPHRNAMIVAFSLALKTHLVGLKPSAR